MTTRILTSALSFADIQRAVAGDARQLEDVVKAVLHDVYGLALRLLWHTEDAEDTTQEIAIRVVTGLSGFDGRSSFRTWVYRIACNTLSTQVKTRAENAGLSFDSMSEDLRDGLLQAADLHQQDSAYSAALVEEVKIGCTHAMLTCLDREHRLAYILGTILDIDHLEAASALAISPAAFRKRLSRANDRISAFVMRHCGIADSANDCRCEKLVPKAIACARVDPENLQFSKATITMRQLTRVTTMVRQLETTRRAAAIFRSHPDFDLAAQNLGWVVELFSPPSDASGRGATRMPVGS